MLRRCAAVLVLAAHANARNETRAAHYAKRAAEEKVRVIHGSVRSSPASLSHR